MVLAMINSSPWNDEQDRSLPTHYSLGRIIEVAGMTDAWHLDQRTQTKTTLSTVTSPSKHTIFNESIS